MAGILTSDEIAEFRGLVETLAFPDTFALVRDTVVADGAGGYTTTPTTVASGACRLRSGALQPAERAVADRLGWDVPYAIDLPYSVVLTPADRLLIDGDRTFEVGAIVDTGTWAMTKVALCQEIG